MTEAGREKGGGKWLLSGFQLLVMRQCVEPHNALFPCLVAALLVAVRLEILKVPGDLLAKHLGRRDKGVQARKQPLHHVVHVCVWGKKNLKPSPHAWQEHPSPPLRPTDAVNVVAHKRVDGRGAKRTRQVPVCVCSVESVRGRGQCVALIARSPSPGPTGHPVMRAASRCSSRSCSCGR